MYCITFLTIINDGLSTFLLMICLLIWLMVYFHNIDNTERFKVITFTDKISLGV